MWLERKILPDTLLRSYIEDIGASNDDASSGFFSKRPSRSERAVDDPIREMEGMLVDEYGRCERILLTLSSRIEAFQEVYINFLTFSAMRRFNCPVFCRLMSLKRKMTMIF